MNPVIILPLLSAALLFILYVRIFTRVSGLTLSAIGLLRISAVGVLLTLILTLLFNSAGAINVYPGLSYNRSSGLVGYYLAPTLEEILKAVALLFLFRFKLVATEPLQLYRQRVLAGIILGITFGTLETYLLVITRLSDVNGGTLLGSIPLHLVSSGFIAASLAGAKKLHWRVILITLIIIFHLLYNQLLILPIPISYFSFLLLLIGAIWLLVTLRQPRDFTQDE